jgi:CubicO group peptidase (beta-lactamase class C family)
MYFVWKGVVVDTLFADFNKPDSPGASLLVIKNGRSVLEKSYGLANVEDNIPVAPHTNFRLASVSKQFTAMAIMILLENKKLTLKTTLKEIFPEFSDYGKKINIRFLLNHTSGLLDYEDLIPRGTTMPVIDRDVLWIMEQQSTTAFTPGTQYSYSNTGYSLLACIVEKLSGYTYAYFMKKNIFEPLKMKNTMLNERGITVIPNRAYGYSLQSSKFVRTDQGIATYVLGDGGIYSSVRDLFKWDQALYTSKLVSRKMLKEAFTTGPAAIDKQNRGYGFGWRIEYYKDVRCLSHSGSTNGFSTMIRRFVDQKLTIILLTNRKNLDASLLSLKVADLYLAD